MSSAAALPLVGGVNHVDERIGVLVVVLPVRPDVLLATNVPHVQLEASLLHRLDVEALRRRDVRWIHLQRARGIASRTPREFIG